MLVISSGENVRCVVAFCLSDLILSGHTPYIVRIHVGVGRVNCRGERDTVTWV
jgi:hypothetical protein